jgi:hypothetical protein
MFKAFVLGALRTIVIALVGVYFVLRDGIIPANADATPEWVENGRRGHRMQPYAARLRAPILSL